MNYQTSLLSATRAKAHPMKRTVRQKWRNIPAERHDAPALTSGPRRERSLRIRLQHGTIQSLVAILATEVQLLLDVELVSVNTAGNFGKRAHGVQRPNDPSSATRPTRACDCNRDAMAGLDVMLG